MKFRSKRKQHSDEIKADTCDTMDLAAEAEEELIMASAETKIEETTDVSSAAPEIEEAADISFAVPEIEEAKVMDVETADVNSCEKQSPGKTDKTAEEENDTFVFTGGKSEVNNTNRMSSIPDGVEQSPGSLLIVRIIVAIVAILLPRFIDIPDLTINIIYIAAALIAGYDIAIAAATDMLKRVYLRENLPLIIAAVCSFAIGRGFEGAVSVIILQAAYISRSILVRKTKMTQLCEVTLPPPDKGVSVGDTIMVNEGSHVPTDCSVIEGRGMVDCSFITGDISPVQFKSGDFIPAGCVCLSGQMMLKAETLSESAVSAKIGSTIDSGYKAVTETENRIFSVARFVTPVMLLVSLIMLIILPFSYDYSFAEALRRVITIIAISSPCAALLSVPMSYLFAIISARRAGIVFRNASLLDKTATVKTVAFDKVGTVTNDSYVVADICSDKMDPVMFLKVAAHAAAVSNRPVAKAIVSAYGDYINFDLVKDFVEYRGKGVSVLVEGIKILLGCSEFMAENGVALPAGNLDGTAVFMAVQGAYAGRIVLKDSVNTSIPDAINELYASGVDRVAMISSDGRERDGIVAREAGINEYYAECSAEDKARRIKELRSRAPAGSSIAYVGCGDYCEQACRNADIGIILRGMENRYSARDADVVVMGRAVKAVPDAIARAHKVRITAMIKFGIALLFKLLIVILAAAGIAPLWFGLLLDNCVSLALTLNYSGFLRQKINTANV